MARFGELGFRAGDGPAEDAETVARLLAYIDDMLESGQYEWARDTLEGIATTVSDSGRVTPGQRTAVSNIEVGGQKHRDDLERGARKTWRRRYNGYRWR